MKPVRAVAMLVVVLLLSAAPAAAQVRVGFAPTIGIYAPTGDLVNSVIAGRPVTLKMKVGLAIGARLGIFFTEHLGLSLGGSYVPSQAQVTIDSTGVFANDPTNTNLWFGTARLTFWVLPPRKVVSLGFSGGLGLAGRGSTTLVDNLGNSITSPSATDVGGVVGGTIGFNLGGFGIFFGVDDYIYNPTVFVEQGVKTNTQNDLQISFGFGIPLGGYHR
jgi:hypothetical protein